MKLTPGPKIKPQEIFKCGDHEFGFNREQFYKALPHATHVTCPFCGAKVQVVGKAEPDREQAAHAEYEDLIGVPSDDWLATAESNGISKALFNDRVKNLGWTPERAATTLKRGSRGTTG